MSLVIPVILGSVRSDRQAARVGHFVVQLLRARGHEAPIVDPLELKLPLLDRMFKEYDESDAPPALRALAALYRRSDAILLVSGEYNHGIPPAMKNTLDHFLEEYFWRPSAIVCYSAGQFGGVRAAMQLRMTLSELGTPSIPSLLPIPRVASALDSQGRPMADWLDKSANRFLDELEWYAKALKTQRALGTPY
jgi:NAD(P)H-dependent FMN reductase